MPFSFEDASPDDAQALAELRVIAMQPSLEAVGRFDPDRARERFLSTYQADQTQTIVSGGFIIGFYVLIDRGDHLYLDHLYVLPDRQGAGIGFAMIEHIKLLATHKKVPIRVGALRDSRANAFYLNQGFTFQYEEDWDLFYQWSPSL